MQMPSAQRAKLGQVSPQETEKLNLWQPMH